MTPQRETHLVIVVLVVALLALLALTIWAPAHAHDIYAGVHGRNGQLCCGADDCKRTHYRLINGHYSFYIYNQPGMPDHWEEIPADRITWLPIPNDEGPAADDLDGNHYAHICFRTATDNDRAGPGAQNVFGAIFLYCAFIPPGAI